MKSNPMNRRDLLRKAIGVMAVAPVSVFAFQALAQNKAPAGAAPKFVSITDPVPKAFNYVEDASASPLRKAKKAPIDGSKQFCDNCTHYTAQAGIDGGKCALFGGGLVKPKAWCAQWIGPKK